jgi:F0F1-type ATP synthase assembly protein I
VSDDRGDVLASHDTAWEQRRQRQAIAWGSGLFLGIGIGAVVGYAVDDYMLGLMLAVIITVVTAVIYLGVGYVAAERRAEDIVARDARDDDEDDE